MAQQDPGQPMTETSYSDPIYDRLEALSRGLAQRWPLVLTLFALAVVAGLMLQQQHQSTPEAASAARFIEARSDSAALAEMLADNGETAEFRARAAMELAQIALDEKDAATAISRAQEGLALIDAKKLEKVALSLRLSIAAGQRGTGAFDAALAELRGVEQAAQHHPAHKIQARIAQVEILCQQASSLGDDGAEQRQSLLKEALSILEPIQADSDPARRQLRQYASYLFYRIRYEHPELVSSDVVVDATPVNDETAPVIDEATTAD